MKKVTRLLSMGLGAAVLASGILVMPGNKIVVQAQSQWESLNGAMVNIVAYEGDGQISFTWNWDEDMVQVGKNEGYTTDYAFYTTYNLNEWANNMDNVSLNDKLIVDENTWTYDIPYDVEETKWTITGLQNGTSYYFSNYMDYVDGEFIFPALTPVAAGNTTDNNQGTTEQQPSDNNQGTTEQQPSGNDQGTTEQQPSDNNQGVVEQPTFDNVQTEDAGVREFYKTLNGIVNQINNAEAGTTIVVEGDAGFSALPNYVMHALYVKGDVNLEFSYSYNEKNYVIVIPAGQALNADIPWYGPLYLASMYEK